ncbi:MAG: hypothetical protein EOP68_20140 [Sphingomonas sp.]|nr:MAG: hypothetical protein EOP68_20140 [Sphingomonas sp.]
MLDRRSFLLGSAAIMALASGRRGCAASDLPPATARTIDVRGLAAPIEIVDDAYGVPHIRAGSIPDAFFGQGYVVARDRLFQIDFSQRRELGRMAAGRAGGRRDPPRRPRRHRGRRARPCGAQAAAARRSHRDRAGRSRRAAHGAPRRRRCRSRRRG